MTGTDLIVLTPWIVFAAGLAVIGFLLLRSHRASRPRPRATRSRRPPQPPDHPDPEEARCPEPNAQARPQ
jgi:hypothetical protein